MQQKSVATRGGEMVWKQQLLRRGTPFEVGSLIAWLLCDQSKYITGSVQVSSLFSLFLEVVVLIGVRLLMEGGFAKGLWL
jgi:hypothetical protein